MPNDFIKLGRITFKIREIFLNKKQINPESKKSQKKPSSLLEKRTLTDQDHDENFHEDEKSTLKQCRICLSDDNSTPQGTKKSFTPQNSLGNKTEPENKEKISVKFYEDNPYINPCKCSGTMKYIHVNCLQLWLASKIQIKQSSECCKTLSWKNIECELCKYEFPSKKKFLSLIFFFKSGYDSP